MQRFHTKPASSSGSPRQSREFGAHCRLRLLKHVLGCTMAALAYAVSQKLLCERWRPSHGRSKRLVLQCEGRSTPTIMQLTVMPWNWKMVLGPDASASGGQEENGPRTGRLCIGRTRRKWSSDRTPLHREDKKNGPSVDAVSFVQLMI